MAKKYMGATWFSGTELATLTIYNISQYFTFTHHLAQCMAKVTHPYGGVWGMISLTGVPICNKILIVFLKNMQMYLDVS